LEFILSYMTGGSERFVICCVRRLEITENHKCRRIWQRYH